MSTPRITRFTANNPQKPSGGLPTSKHALLQSVLWPVIVILGFFSPSLSAQIIGLPAVSIRGGSATPEYCPPDVNCPRLSFVISRSGPGLDRFLSVAIGYSGTATPGTDYHELPPLVTFAPGEDRVTISALPIDDSVYEGDETVLARLLFWNTSPDNQYIIISSNAVASVTILENDPASQPPVVSLELIDPEAMETLIYQNNIDWAEFRVHRTGPLTNDLTVFLNTAQGSARLGEDYRWDGVTEGNRVRIPAGYASLAVRLYPIDDFFYEDDETAFTHLIAPPAGTPSSGQYTIELAHSSVAMVIHDNEPVATRLDITAPLNGQHFEAGAVIELRAQVIGPGKSNTWNVTFFDGDQLIGTTRPGASVWWPNASGGQHVINARATNPTGEMLTAAPATIQVGPGPTLPIVSIGTPLSWPEITSEPCPVCLVAPGELRISRTGPVGEPLTVYLETDGTATPDKDYKALPVSVTIPAGTNSALLLVIPFDDLLAEGPEVIRASIARPPELATLGYLVNVHASEAFVVIRDDEAGAPAARLDIIEPEDGAQVAGPVVQISALGVYANGEISRPVEFYSGTTLIGRSDPPQLLRPSIPYLPSVHTIQWTNPPPGEHVLTARSQLSLNEWVEAPPVRIKVGSEPPFVPVISIRARVPETREPLCDPAICDAALPEPGVFMVSRFGGDVTSQLTVLLGYRGTATANSDYSLLPVSITFNSGATSVELLVEASHDVLAEGDETVIADLLPDPSLGPIERYRVDPLNASARVVIHDNDVLPPPVVSIEATSPIAEESSYPYRRLPLRGQFTISRTGSLDHGLPVFVHYTGTAAPGVDYPALPWLVTIPAGTNRVELEVVATPDDKPEPVETVVATLAQCPPLTSPALGIPCYEVSIDPARSSARVFIRDDGITTASLEITSPKDGAEFREGASIPIAATAIDLQGAITRVEFFDGNTKIGESTILFFREPDPGTPIHHEFLWINAAAGPHVLTARAVDSAGLAVTSAPVRILVGEGLPVVSIEATVRETMEPSPESRVQPGVFTLRRTGDASKALRVWMHYAGTAINGVDYVSPPSTVEFPAGSNRVEILISGLDDNLVEGDETVIGRLVPSPLAVVPDFRIDPVNNQAQVVIHDNDSGNIPTVSLRATQPFTAEPCPVCLVAPGVFTFSRAGGNTNESLAVWYLLGGTARNGEDYARLSGQVIIPAGRMSVEVLVLPILDALSEGEETVVAQLYVPLNADLIRPYHIDPNQARATVIIRDSLTTPPGLPTVSITATDAFARECGGSNTSPNIAVFTVQRAGPTNNALTVHFRVSGSASNGVDYALVSSPVTIPAGHRGARIAIVPIDDHQPEPVETVVVALSESNSTSSGYHVGSPRSAAAVIADNDCPRPQCVRLLDGRFNLCLPADASQCFQVESTRDLKTWIPICTLPVSEGVVHYVDPDTDASPQQFYRLVPVACDTEDY